jgi:hypothetical protein
VLTLRPAYCRTEIRTKTRVPVGPERGLRAPPERACVFVPRIATRATNFYSLSACSNALSVVCNQQPEILTLGNNFYEDFDREQASTNVGESPLLPPGKYEHRPTDLAASHEPTQDDAASPPFISGWQTTVVT